MGKICFRSSTGYKYCYHTITEVTVNTIFIRIEAPGAKTKFWGGCASASLQKKSEDQCYCCYMWIPFKYESMVPGHKPLRYFYDQKFLCNLLIACDSQNVNLGEIFNLPSSKKTGGYLYSRGCLNSNKYGTFI